jgi:hypothetical protein
MQDGDLQLFGLEEGGILDNMPLEEDHVTAVAAFEAEPYVLLGCASGAVRVVALLKDGGTTADGVGRINSMERLPYTGELVLTWLKPCITVAFGKPLERHPRHVSLQALL